jgi:hypothetical protein
MLPIKKIYIDSRYKTPDSASHSDFSIDLPNTLLMPSDTGFYIDDVCIPHTWYPVEQDVNNWIVFKYNGTVNRNSIAEGNYSTKDLNTAIVDAMNDVMPVLTFVSAYNFKKNTIGIALADSGSYATFSILTDAELSETSYAKKSMNKLLKNFTPGEHGSPANLKTPFTSGYVDMYPLRNIYITSSGLGNFNTISVSGENRVVKKVPVNAGHGDIIFDQTVTGIDYLDCSHQTLSRIGFKLQDIFGRVINLQGNHVSFSIVFSRVQDGR